MRTPPITRLAVVVAFFVAPAASGKVWSVASSGGDFTQIQLAVDASADGDIVLVAPGVYFESVVVSGKSLTLAAEQPGTAVFVKRVSVQSIAASQRVVLRGLDLVDAFPGVTFVEGVQVSACVGAVWLEDCVVHGRAGYALFNQVFAGEEALLVTTSPAVTAVRCSFVGGVGYSSFPFPGPAGRGVRVPSGSLALWDCTVTGGGGGSAPGVGLRIDSGKLMTSGVTISGGSATTTGLEVTSASVTVESLDSTFSSVVAPPGTLSTWPASSRSFELLTPVIENQTVTARMRGLPGDHVFLFWSLAGGRAQIAGTQGWYVLGPPVGPFFLLTLSDPGGTESFFAPAPPLVQPLLGGFTFLVQAYFLNPGETVAGAPTVFVLLKS